MNRQHSTAQWSEAGQLDTMDMHDIDFNDFLDMGDIDLATFSSLDQPNHPDVSQTLHHAADVTFTSAASQPYLPAPSMVHDYGAGHFDLPVHMVHQEQAIHAVPNGADTSDREMTAQSSNQSWQQQQQEQQQQQISQTHSNNVYHPPQHVPPTPNSFELHGNPSRYLQRQMDPQSRAFLEQRYQLNKDNAMAFAPLISPAVTPQDSHFHTVPEYTVPGAYFSPLTSPALVAQGALQHPHQMQACYTHASTAASSVATSPTDLNMDLDMPAANAMLPEPARRMRRITQTQRSTSPSSRVRNSPIVKPNQKRKSTHLSSVIPSSDMNNIFHEAIPQPGSAGLARNPPFDSSGTDSISPEPLSASLMGPPPRPASIVQSPALQAQSHSAPASTTIDGNPGAPATPASLMSLQRARAQQMNAAHNGPNPISSQPQAMQDTNMIDDFSLPPAVNIGMNQDPALNRIETTLPVASAETTPRLAPRKTPKLGPTSTPASAISLHSATSSPSISAITSPVNTGTPSTLKGKDSKSSRISKKRGSVGGGNVLISPAIRPKISPSIKPMLPEGASLNESQQALLLASKSNYTHILEGTLLPGVTYPESLSSGLTSKRTSHKIAEQGRRNRINEALKEMQSLLPKVGTKAKSSSGTPNGADKSAADDDDDEGEKDDTKGGSAESKNSSSKAAMVENAIEYIKVLQHERAQAAQALKEKDAEMAMLRQKLQNVEIKLGGGSVENPTVDGAATSTEKAITEEKTITT